jgi:hypothetical protein
MRQKMISKIEELESDANENKIEELEEEVNEEEVPPAEVVTPSGPLVDDSAPRVRSVAHLSRDGKVFKSKESNGDDIIPVVQPQVLESILKKPDPEPKPECKKVLIQEIDDDKADIAKEVTTVQEKIVEITETTETQDETEAITVMESEMKITTIEEKVTTATTSKPKSNHVASVKVSKELMQEISLKKAAEDELCKIAPAADEPDAN